MVDKPTANQPQPDHSRHRSRRSTDQPTGRIRQSAESAVYRWECACQRPAVLLATLHEDGKLNMKVGDRYWHAFGFGQVKTICPRCGCEHYLDLRQQFDE